MSEIWHPAAELPPISKVEEVDAETIAIYRGPVLAWCRGQEWKIAAHLNEETRDGGYEFHGWLNAQDDGGTAEVLAWTFLPDPPRGTPGT